MPLAEKERQALNHHRLLEAFHEMHKVRDFQPVLCADVWDPMRGHAVDELERAVWQLERRADDFFSKLSIISIPRESPPLLLERFRSYCGPPWIPL